MLLRLSGHGLRILSFGLIIIDKYVFYYYLLIRDAHDGKKSFKKEY